MKNRKVSLGYSPMESAFAQARRNIYGYHYDAVEAPVHSAAYDETETPAAEARRALYHRWY